MDISEFDLMVKLPHLMQGDFLDKMISDMLDSENIKSNQPPTVTIKNGIMGIPSTINTDWTQRATGASFLEPVPTTEATNPQRKGYEFNNLSRGCEKQVKRRKNKAETEMLPYCTSKRKKDQSKQSEVIKKSQSSFERHPSIGAAGLYKTTTELEAVPPIAIEEKTNFEPSSCTENFGTMPEQRCSPDRKLQTADSISLDGLTLSNLDQGLKNEDTPHKPLLVKLREGATESTAKDESEMEQVIDTLVKAQTKFCSETPKPGTKEWKELRQEQAIVREKRDSLQARLSREEIGGYYVKIFEAVIKECVSFAKSIPGFRELHMDDQITLIKACRQGTSLPSAIRSLNTEVRIITPLPGHHFAFEDFSALDSDIIAGYLRELSSRSIWQTTTMVEDAIIKAIMVTDTDRCIDLRDRETINRMHHYMISCLIHVVEKSTRDIPKRKEELDYLLLACGRFSMNFRKYFKEILMKMPVHANNEIVKYVL